MAAEIGLDHVRHAQHRRPVGHGRRRHHGRQVRDGTFRGGERVAAEHAQHRIDEQEMRTIFAGFGDGAEAERELALVIEKPAYAGQELLDPPLRGVLGICGNAEEAGALVVEQGPLRQHGRERGRRRLFASRGHEGEQHVTAADGVEDIVLAAL